MDDLLPFFARQIDKILKSYPNSNSSLNNLLLKISDNPLSFGNRMPGFDQHIRKIRAGFPEYKISKRDGARIIILVTEQQKPIFISIYLKSKSKGEQAEIKYIKDKLKEIKSELE